MGIESCLWTKLCGSKKFGSSFFGLSAFMKFWSSSNEERLNVRMIYGLLTTLKNLLWHKYTSAKKKKKKKKNEKNIFIAVKKFLLHQVVAKYCKPGLYVICDKCEFLCSCFSIVDRFLNLIVNLKDCLLGLSASPCGWKSY